jgi:RNA polymerase sigma-70 factor (ECF subfamily)
MQQPETRPSLIVRLKGERNELAWTEFVSAYEPFLRRLIERQGVPERHVADATQQVLVAVARSVDGWQDDGDPASFRRWLNRVARNVVLKFMARERRQIGGQGGTDWLESLAHVPDAGGDQRETEYEYELVVWAAEQVRGEFLESSWRAFWATLIEGRSVAEVAAELGVSPGSVYMSRSRLMARIRSKVQEVMGRPEDQSEV